MATDEYGPKPGHDAWAPVDHSPIKVNVASLADYVQLVGKEIDDFNTNLRDGVLPMTKVQSTFAGFGEAKLYRGVHANALAATGEMLQDVSYSLQAIAQAALGIYYEYVGGDDVGRANVDDVYDVFWPGDGRSTVQSATSSNSSSPAPVAGSYFNSWDEGFTVGEGGNAYSVPGNENDMMGAPEDPLRQR
ncbi:hypothetical protein [Dactylosporangium sp. CS-033363]|uniref:hypothetical protein n=1 Tax=Dactylosporangium sp. CS-033363 TaxID=3239935 RepID=UPI003D8B78CD